MSYAESFPPVESRQARVLVLGSMPGQKSLEEQQYYAHPQNAFWKIMAELFDFPSTLAYSKRLQKLRQHHLALWDVMQACYRPGSLDSAIEEASIVPNDFASFFKAHPRIRTVCFNGMKAEHAFKKHVLPTLSEPYCQLNTVRLPSTSPANARMNLAQKLEAWQIVREAVMD